MGEVESEQIVVSGGLGVLSAFLRQKSLVATREKVSSSTRSVMGRPG